MKLRMRLCSAFAVTALGMGIAISPSGAAPSSAPQPVIPQAPAFEKTLQVVQLGDSYSAGNGTGNYTETDCYRSPSNYGAQAAKAMGASYKNVACSGAMLHDLVHPRNLGWRYSITRSYWIADTKDPAAEFLRRAKADNLCGNPRQADYYFDYRVVAPAPLGRIYTATVECRLMVKPQLEAVNADTDLVFLTIGGNDANFFQIALTCVVGRNASGCQSAIQNAHSATPKMVNNLRYVLQEISRRSHGKAQVYLLSYPTLLNPSSYTLPEGPAGWFNAAEQLTYLQAAADQAQGLTIAEVNRWQERQGISPTMHYVTGVKEAFKGHGVDPKLGAKNWDSWLVPPFYRGYGFMEYMHPVQAGWDATAEVLKNHLKADGYPVK